MGFCFFGEESQKKIKKEVFTVYQKVCVHLIGGAKVD